LFLYPPSRNTPKQNPRGGDSKNKLHWAVGGWVGLGFV
jgi:hypothetical protein